MLFNFLLSFVDTPNSTIERSCNGLLNFSSAEQSKWSGWQFLRCDENKPSGEKGEKFLNYGKKFRVNTMFACWWSEMIYYTCNIKTARFLGDISIHTKLLSVSGRVLHDNKIIFQRVSLMFAAEFSSTLQKLPRERFFHHWHYALRIIWKYKQDTDRRRERFKVVSNIRTSRHEHRAKSRDDDVKIDVHICTEFWCLTILFVCCISTKALWIYFFDMFVLTSHLETRKTKSSIN